MVLIGLKLSGFGPNFQTIQLEISRRVRDNPELLRPLAEILAEILDEFNGRFSLPFPSEKKK